MIDDDTLAHRVHSALAAGGGGTLHVHELGAVGSDLLLYNDAGRPRFLCPPGNPIEHAATEARAAVLCVSPRGFEPEFTSVVLAGHLRCIGTEQVDGQPVGVIELDICSVIVERDEPESPTVVQRELPLVRYRAAAPDLMTRTADRIVAHTNTAHGEQLRTFVAELRGVAEDDVVAAELTELDESGVGLTWVDRNGAHQVRLRFPSPARCAADLARRLRETLVGATHDA